MKPSGLALALLVGCAATPPAPTVVALVPVAHNLTPSARAQWTGAVRYEARHATLQGLSQALDVRPARFVDVEARSADGVALSRAQTDGEGRFALDAPTGSVTVAAVVHIHTRGHDVSVSPDGSPRATFVLSLPVRDPSRPIELTAPDAAPDGIAGAFHIADTVLRGLDATLTWTGRALPPVMMRWGRGVTNNWSFYLGQRPPGSGRYMIELLGGPPGGQAFSDCDEHDEGIILHELGHYVFDMLSTNSSTGGGHPPGSNVNPGLAWEEGRATWFAQAVLQEPHYRDTIGIEPQGRLRVDYDLETASTTMPLGLGSELSTEEVLWDLSDGAQGIADTDNDGVSLGPEVLMRAMMTDRETAGSYPCLASFLRTLVNAHRIEQGALRTMLARTGQPAEILPENDVSVWPIDLTLPGRAGGKIDGLTEPAPSGGPRRPDDGFDAVKVYRVHVTQAGRLSARLVIQGSGRPTDHSDIDMELRDIRGEMLSFSRGTGPTELISRVVDAGWYVLYVRDGGSGNRARYSLDVSTIP